MHSYSTGSLCFTVRGVICIHTAHIPCFLQWGGWYAFTYHRVHVFYCEGYYAFTQHRVPVFYSEGSMHSHSTGSMCFTVRGSMHSHSTGSLCFTVRVVCIHIAQGPCVLE